MRNRRKTKWTVATVRDEVVVTVAYKKKDRRSLPEEFSDWTAFVHIVFEPPYFTPILHSM